MLAGPSERGPAPFARASTTCGVALVLAAAAMYVSCAAVAIAGAALAVAANVSMAASA